MFLDKGNDLYRSYIKRLLDIIFSLFFLVILSPLFVVIWLLVCIKLGNPAIFKQKRPGFFGKIFVLYKFRSMNEKKDEFGVLLPDSERLTKFGLFLRSTSLDELPELWNILKGEMSFIGPRPLLVQYLPLYNEKQKHRHDVRPGLTGLAQVNGRNKLSWPEKFALDLEYVKKLSFVLDFKIIVLTFKKVIIREGISGESNSTVEYFKGNSEEKE